ncbi:MIEF1 upstream open reading frame protein [Uranotaenia lowii]|uniref:MIEF1 upstream open reading frame protein n=1 Tax=Uranotaenia lowii TaxID=190385 RepID=UPI0024793A8A|nr:MIEF1 upstream open reading frame protein [Uranotaenia lowii]
MNVTTSLTTKRLVLRLYRDLRRYGSQLQFTDRDYFLRRIRQEFDQSRSLTDPKDIEFCYKRGRELLDKARVI